MKAPARHARKPAPKSPASATSRGAPKVARKEAPKDPRAALRAFALSLPGAREEFPWGERVAKVGTKVFVYLGRDDAERAEASAQKAEHVGRPGDVTIAVKLPESREVALSSGHGRPTEYGLGAKGWVTLTFPAKKRVPVDHLRAWIEESYRAVAPKRLVKELSATRARSGTSG
jgi:predicted DNA-binding protein (MmcQ/YjbR family)